MADPRARDVAESLTARGVRVVALTFVDNAGVTRVKAVPVERLEAVPWTTLCIDDARRLGR